jgi:hypothetical protein
MSRLLTVFVPLFLLAVPATMFAKAITSKIIIKGADLKTPIEITDPKTLANYEVWSGPGTSWTGTRAEQGDGFIVDWSRAVTEPPKGLQRYEVCFYAKLPDEQLIYVVFYEYDPASGDGYIYLPGRTEQWYRLDVSTIFRGVEGKWFRASKLWEGVARPLIAGAEVTVLSTGPDHSR